MARHVHVFSISGPRTSHVTQNRLLSGDSPEVSPLLDETGMIFGWKDFLAKTSPVVLHGHMTSVWGLE